MNIGAVDTDSKAELSSLMFHCVGQWLLIYQVYGSQATALALSPASELEAGEHPIEMNRHWQCEFFFFQ
jgi:hypothetical protein